jgi:Skp family chaperone for outer membrane proteins
MEAMQEELVQTYTQLNKCQQQNKEMSPMRKENEALKSQLRISEERLSILRLNAASVDRERQLSSPRSTEFSSRTPASPGSTNVVQLLRKVVAERELELHTCRDKIKSLEKELENKGELLRLAARSEHSLEQDLISAQRRGDALQQQVADQQFQLQQNQKVLSSPSSAFTFLVPCSPSSPILNKSSSASF